MNIYQITWSTPGGFDLRAVVAANSPQQASNELELPSDFTLGVAVREVGKAGPDISEPTILAWEQL